MKILYVTTLSNTINAFLIPHIQMLINQGHSVDFACCIDRKIDLDIFNNKCKIFNIEFNRSPLSGDNLRAYKKLQQIIHNENYELVHTHTPVASVIVRLVCKDMNNVRVFYTAHGFHFFKGAPIINWLFYYPMEKWLARYTDTLITVNTEDYNMAKKLLKARRIEYIPGVGLDIKKIDEVVVDKVEKRKEIGVPKDAFVVLSVGELNCNKNHETIIRAISKIGLTKVNYVICGLGTLENYIKTLSKELNIEKQVHILGLRNDIAEICKASDVFAFPSNREGLGMAALEAMASGLPIITSNVHGINDYSINGQTGFKCNPRDINGFAEAIQTIMNNKHMRKKMEENNKEYVKKYDLNNVLYILNEIYKK